MPYLISALAAAVGAVVLLTLLMRLIGPARRLAGTARVSRAGLADRSGLLAARIAALRVELARRRRRNAETPSEAPAA
ncbi:MAG: bacteriophage holin [Pseudonocardiaceae bacterium]